jgi:hypothetical protein
MKTNISNLIRKSSAVAGLVGILALTGCEKQDSNEEAKANTQTNTVYLSQTSGNTSTNSFDYSTKDNTEVNYSHSSSASPSSTNQNNYSSQGMEDPLVPVIHYEEGRDGEQTVFTNYIPASQAYTSNSNPPSNPSYTNPSGPIFEEESK